MPSDRTVMYAITGGCLAAAFYFFLFLKPSRDNQPNVEETDDTDLSETPSVSTNAPRPNFDALPDGGEVSVKYPTEFSPGNGDR